ncbi:MAG: membrane protein insertion efficiency factor YidD [Deltaproteobacteria bacterium]|nr:membrane protein insertion efficiency factor YidD [Deltaproteobacteria bacterium]
MSHNLFLQILGKILVTVIRVYQICISPLFTPCCRFHPSCSEYAITAVRRYGPIRGLSVSLMRLLRCHPFHPGGYDPVK